MSKAYLNSPGQVTSGLLSGPAGTLPAPPSTFTGWALDPTNGLRFIQSGQVTSQYGIQSGKVVDPSSGITRVEWGNLGANGLSTAGFKFRANSATGAAVFDSDGLIQSMNAWDAQTSSDWNLTTANTWTAVPNTSITVSFSRQAKILVWAPVLAYLSVTGGGGTLYVTAYMDGVDGNLIRSVPIWDSGNERASGTVVAGSTVVPAGSHTFQLYAQIVDNGTGRTGTVVATSSIFLLQFGG